MKKYSFENIIHHPNALWIVDHAKEISVGAVIFIALFVLACRLFFAGGTVSEYVQIEARMTELRQQAFEGLATEEKKRAFVHLANTLEKQLKQRPQLQPSYDGQIAQLLINVGMIKKAEPFAKRALAGLSKHQLPLLSSFTENSLLISHGKELAVALKNGEVLEKKFAETEHYRLFSAFNLLQEASLYRHLDMHQNEILSLRNWTDATQNTDRRKLFHHLSQPFNMGTLSLSDYLKNREQNLKNL